MRMFVGLIVVFYWMRRLHAVLARPCSLDVVLRFSNSFILSEHPTYIDGAAPR